MSRLRVKLKLEFTDASDLGRLAVRIENAIKRIVIMATKMAQAEVKEVLEATDTIASGKLKDAIHRRVRKLVNSYAGKVFVNKRVSYAKKVMEGQPPGTKVSPRTIKRWIRNKQARSRSGKARTNKYMFWFVTDKTIDKVAFNIARSIAKKGTKGIRFFDIAMKQVKPKIMKEARKIAKEELSKGR